VGQNDLDILLERNRQREVDRAEGLSLARQRRADEHALRRRAAAGLDRFACREQDLPLDDAELLEERGHVTIGVDQPVGPEPCTIDRLWSAGEFDLLQRTRSRAYRSGLHVDDR